MTSTIKYPRVVDQKKNQDPSCSAEALRWRPHSGGFDPQLGRVSKGAGFGKKWKHMGKKTLEKTRCIMLKDWCFLAGDFESFILIYGIVLYFSTVKHPSSRRQCRSGRYWWFLNEKWHLNLLNLSPFRERTLCTSYQFWLPYATDAGKHFISFDSCVLLFGDCSTG